MAVKEAGHTGEVLALVGLQPADEMPPDLARQDGRLVFELLGVVFAEMAVAGFEGGQDVGRGFEFGDGDQTGWGLGRVGVSAWVHVKRGGRTLTGREDEAASRRDLTEARLSAISDARSGVGRGTLEPQSLATEEEDEAMMVVGLGALAAPDRARSRVAR